MNHLQAFADHNGLTDKSIVQSNTYRPCPSETYPASYVRFTMTSAAFPGSIFSEWAADLTRRDLAEWENRSRWGPKAA